MVRWKYIEEEKQKKWIEQSERKKKLDENDFGISIFY